jgi:hypothetical protein
MISCLATLPISTNAESDPMSEADPMEEMHLAPRFSVTERRNQRLQLRACPFHVAVAADLSPRRYQ